jgi:hypothetical protein
MRSYVMAALCAAMILWQHLAPSRLQSPHSAKLLMRSIRAQRLTTTIIGIIAVTITIIVTAGGVTAVVTAVGDPKISSCLKTRSRGPEPQGPRACRAQASIPHSEAS